MAVKVTPKLFRNFHQITRQFSSTPSSIPILPFNFDEKPDLFNTNPSKTEPFHPSSSSILNFNDTKNLFSSFSNTKLLKSTINLKMASMDPVVEMGMWVMRSKLTEIPGFRQAILGSVKHSFYEQFVAGKDLMETSKMVGKLWEAGLKGMLNYGLEHAYDNRSCDQNYQTLFNTVESTNIFVPSSEEEDLELAHERLTKLCQRCLELNVPLAVDAEDTKIQPGIDYLTYNSAIEFNKFGKNPIVYGTIQTYMKDAKERLLLATNAAEKMGLPLGFKLVRGAYMSSETKLANSLGFDSPIHNTIQDTHNCYNDCASFMLDKIVDGSGAVVLATHNVESGKLAATKARELGIEEKSERLQFAQLYGMSEAFSYGLVNAGFQVSKYLTFGPVDQVIPYLLRRAEENRGLLSSSTLDKQLMWMELKRRVKERCGV